MTMDKNRIILRVTRKTRTFLLYVSDAVENASFGNFICVSFCQGLTAENEEVIIFSLSLLKIDKPHRSFYLESTNSRQKADDIQLVCLTLSGYKFLAHLRLLN